jgi:hypothetical protein
LSADLSKLAIDRESKSFRLLQRGESIAHAFA